MFDAHPWLLVLAVFLARVVDVSLGTVRMILVVRGHRLAAAAIGFCEVLIWVLAVSQVIQNLDSWVLAVAFAGGFATGNIVGMWVEGKLALGQELVRVISEAEQVHMAEALRAERLHVLELDGQGEQGRPVEVLFVVAPRRRVPRVLELIRELDPQAVCTVSDIKHHVSLSPVALRSPLARVSAGRLLRAK